MSKKKKWKKHESDVTKPEQESGNICGNLQLNNQVPSIEIWEVFHEKDATVFVSVFNSPMSTASMLVRVFREDGSTLFFNVPPGNTSSGTVDHAEMIRVSRVNQGNIDGRFSLDVILNPS